MLFQTHLKQVQIGESRRVKGTVDRTAVHRTKIMLPLGRMQKTPSRPFKAGTHLNLDHEKVAREAIRSLKQTLPSAVGRMGGCGDRVVLFTHHVYVFPVNI